MGELVELFQVGDFMRYDRFQGHALDAPLWAVVTQVSSGQGRAMVVLPGSTEYDKPDIIFDREVRKDSAVRARVAEKDVPDEVFVEIARRALLGLKR